MSHQYRYENTSPLQLLHDVNYAVTHGYELVLTGSYLTGWFGRTRVYWALVQVKAAPPPPPPPEPKLRIILGPVRQRPLPRLRIITGPARTRPLSPTSGA
jgi:hypothetical protein